jgi:glycosyltransferase involved in cell wall biosynthesis
MKERPLRICLINNLFPPVPSGSSHFTNELAQLLAQRGHEITVITARVSQESPYLEEENGIAVFRLPCLLFPRLRIAHNFRWMSYTFTPKNVRRVIKIITERRIQVLHLNGHIFDLALSAVRAKRELRLPLVVTVHAKVQHPHPLYGSLLAVADKHLIKRLVMRHCDEIITPDKNYQEYGVSRYGRDDIHLVPYGVKYPIEIEKLDKSWIEKYRLDSRPLIVSLGHVHEIRDRCDLIRAMPHVLQTYPDTILLIVGETFTQKPVALVRELGLEEKVVFTGFLPHNVALGLVKLAHVEAHWTRQFQGGLGIASLEAMALGKPVMTYTRVDLIGNNLLEDWKDILIAPRNDEVSIANVLIKLIGNEELRGYIGRNAETFVRKYYSWDAVCEKMEAIYYNVAERYPVSHY